MLRLWWDLKLSDRQNGQKPATHSFHELYYRSSNGLKMPFQHPPFRDFIAGSLDILWQWAIPGISAGGWKQYEASTIPDAIALFPKKRERIKIILFSDGRKGFRPTIVPQIPFGKYRSFQLVTKVEEVIKDASTPAHPNLQWCCRKIWGQCHAGKWWSTSN